MTSIDSLGGAAVRRLHIHVVGSRSSSPESGVDPAALFAHLVYRCPSIVAEWSASTWIPTEDEGISTMTQSLKAQPLQEGIESIVTSSSSAAVTPDDQRAFALLGAAVRGELGTGTMSEEGDVTDSDGMICEVVAAVVEPYPYVNDSFQSTAALWMDKYHCRQQAVDVVFCVDSVCFDGVSAWLHHARRGARSVGPILVVHIVAEPKSRVAVLYPQLASVLCRAAADSAETQRRGDWVFKVDSLVQKFVSFRDCDVLFSLE